MGLKQGSGETLQIGIPACDELDWLPATLEDLSGQDDLDFEVWVCLNQPPHWDTRRGGGEMVLRNQATHALLRHLKPRLPFELHVLDETKPLPTPAPEEAGVGWARKRTFETIFAAKGTKLIAASLDADTRVAPSYVADLKRAFRAYPNAVACALPYDHPLPDEPKRALQLLRYEIYLRYFQLNLWRIASPYALTALGSALAFRGAAYTKTGGFSVRQAGEDFYLLQKLRKLGPVITWTPHPVRPASRVSHRVPFGTGPLMAGEALPTIESRFPFYDMAHFDRIGATYRAWSTWYEQPHAVPIQDFLDEAMGGDGPFMRMRRNATNPEAFLRACHTRFDGLRILQCLRYYRDRGQTELPGPVQVARLLQWFGETVEPVPFECSRIRALDQCRSRLRAWESRFRKEHMTQWDTTSIW